MYLQNEKESTMMKFKVEIEYKDGKEETIEAIQIEGDNGFLILTINNKKVMSINKEETRKIIVEEI